MHFPCQLTCINRCEYVMIAGSGIARGGSFPVLPFHKDIFHGYNPRGHRQRKYHNFQCAPYHGSWLLRNQNNTCPVTRLMSKGILLCSLLGVTVVMGELVMISVSVVLFFLSCFAFTFSVTSLQFLLSVALFLRSSPTLSRSPYAIPHHNFSLPHLLFPSAFWASALFAGFSSPFLST